MHVATSSLLLLILTVASNRLTGAQEQLKFIQLKPCAFIRESVSVDGSDTFRIPSDYSLCPQKIFSTLKKAYRINAEVDVPRDTPIVFVARDQSSVLEWILPYTPDSYTSSSLEVAQTFVSCSTRIPGNASALLYIDVFTESMVPINYSLSIDIIQPFQMILQERSEVNVIYVHSQMLYFEFPNETSVVTVDVTSDTDNCAVVSLQESSVCPPTYTLYDSFSRGVYQTMTRSAFFTVSKQGLNQPSFYIVLFKANDSLFCHSAKNDAIIPNMPKNISITISPARLFSVYSAAICIPILVIFVIMTITSGALYFLCYCCIVKKPEFGAKIRKLEKAALFCHLTFDDSRLDDTYRCFCLSKSVGQCTNDASDTASNATLGTNNQLESTTDSVLLTAYEEVNAKTEAMNIATHRTCNSSTQTSLTEDLLSFPEDSLRLSHSSTKTEEQLKYGVYVWNTLTVGIFYGIPAFQIVLFQQFSQQLSAKTNGEEREICYYNFRCTIPHSVFPAINNLLSNMGYITAGLAFIVVLIIRDCDQRRRKLPLAQGLLQHTSLYYAMGWALVIEGFLGGLYHMCPNAANFQFDTTFMFIIVGLTLAKILQIRHPDFYAEGFVAFFSFSIVTLITVFGIYADQKSPTAIRVVLLALVVVVLIVFFVSAYKFHQWKYVFKSWKILLQEFKPQCPVRKCLFWKLLLAAVLNAAVAAVLLFANPEDLDIATIVLIFFLFNFAYFLCSYSCLKCYHSEPGVVIPLSLAVIAVGMWCAGITFFSMKTYDTAKTPAESRAQNKECIVGNFYDNHDVWHFIAAAALFFSFLAILALDDGLTYRKHKDIHVF